jgi:hypothetical protein
MLVNIVLTLPDLTRIEETPDGRLLTHNTVTFCEDNEFVSRDIVFLDRLSDDLLADAIGVDVSCVPGVQSLVVGGFEEG